MLLKIIKKIFNRDSEDAQKRYLLSHGMKLGEHSNIYSWNGIDAGKPWLVAIGDYVTISTNVTILTHDASTNVVGCGTKLGRIKIGNNVFVGANTTILCDVKIGDNVVVGAGSVVAHDLESNAVYAGAPAKKICTIEQYRKKYKELRDTRPRFDDIRPWYDWKNATEEEKQYMAESLEEGCGFF